MPGRASQLPTVGPTPDRPGLAATRPSLRPPTPTAAPTRAIAGYPAAWDSPSYWVHIDDLCRLLDVGRSALERALVSQPNRRGYYRGDDVVRWLRSRFRLGPLHSSTSAPDITSKAAANLAKAGSGVGR